MCSHRMFTGPNSKTRGICTHYGGPPTFLEQASGLGVLLRFCRLEVLGSVECREPVRVLKAAAFCVSCLWACGVRGSKLSVDALF